MSMSLFLAQPRLLGISQAVLQEDRQVSCSVTTVHRQYGAENDVTYSCVKLPPIHAIRCIQSD
jgi:hypothetical protein